MRQGEAIQAFHPLRSLEAGGVELMEATLIIESIMKKRKNLLRSIE
ncbi:hypothetical protein RRX38_10080 [Pseudomonas sp. DTU_2021_1001937_2_SI_NGA_ILE_001]|nr:hypothetical protein [Pseudomonas sp. DTU_2021_1001937_2_SI_NGA_ILE_001]WNW11484.1 hypothetical protein RRX38_10080 [Pseudomonas sp. DTU_2021_1001937_2_SI_NGA_ILE_001]